MSGLIGTYLMGCGIDPEAAEANACDIADEIAFDSSRIKAVILEKVETLNEGIFDFTDDDDDDEFYRFDEDTDDDVPVAEILQYLREKRAEKELLESESYPVYIEIHEGDTVKKFFNAESLRSLVDDFLSKPEQDSFIKVAEEILADLPNIPQPDQ